MWIDSLPDSTHYFISYCVSTLFRIAFISIWFACFVAAFIYLFTIFVVVLFFSSLFSLSLWLCVWTWDNSVITHFFICVCIYASPSRHRDSSADSRRPMKWPSIYLSIMHMSRQPYLKRYIFPLYDDVRDNEGKKREYRAWICPACHFFVLLLLHTNKSNDHNI